MQIKIHINEKILYLCDTLDPALEELLHHPETIFIDQLDTHSVKAMLKELTLPEISTGVFLHSDLGDLKAAVFKKFDVIKAAGGLVTNENKELLFIYRRGFWDLPKGKRDDGETMEACALREVQEETGLKQVTLIAPLLCTYHTYHQGTHHILKESHWYTMVSSVHEKLVPQTEEDISEIKWVPATALEPFKKAAYPSIADVLATWQLQEK